MKIKIKLLAVIIFCIFSGASFSQNLIPNASFEGRYSDPTSYAQFKELINDWECDQKIIIKNDGTYYLHTPDYFCTAYHSYPYREYDDNFIIQSISGKDGICYAGMSHAELIEVKLNNSIEKYSIYNIMLSFCDINSMAMPLGYFGYTNSNSTAKLNIYISKSKIKYKDNNTEHQCSSIKFDDFTNNSNTYMKVAEIDIDGSTFAYHKWNTISANFSVNQNGYDWVVIELDIDNSQCNKYVLIDNVQLRNYCIMGCSGTDGPKSIVVNEMHSSSVPFMITGLDNISFIEIEIKQSNNEVYYLALANPPSKIAWDGKCNGVETSAGVYSYSIRCVNDCGEYLTNANFEKVNGPAEITLPHPYFNYNPVTKPLKPCCSALPNIFLSNQVLIQDVTTNTPLLFKAINSVVAGPAVLIPNSNLGNSVVFEAGEYIELLPGFETQAGIDFIARIAPCAPQDDITYLNLNNKLLMSDGKEESLETGEIILSESSIEIDNANSITDGLFQVFPNPTTELLTIEIGGQDYSALISLMDLTGRVLISVQSTEKISVIDVSDFLSGTYILRISLLSTVHSFMVIKQ